MSQMREEAEALATALVIGAADVDEAIDWADAHIAQLDQPHWSLCEVATSRGRPLQDVLGFLQQVPGAAEQRRVMRHLMAHMARKLQRHPARVDQIATALYQLHCTVEIEDPEFRYLVLWASDELDLAGDYRVDAYAEVATEMRKELENILRSEDDAEP